MPSQLNDPCAPSLVSTQCYYLGSMLGLAAVFVFDRSNMMVKLAPLQPEHVAHFHDWLRDPVAIEYSMSTFQNLKTTQQIDDWFAATLQQQNCLNLGIYLEETNALIGYAGLSGISTTNHSGEYFIFIGEQAYWGQGIGTAVTKQVVHLGFTNYQLNRIMLTVSEPNVGGVKAYANAGFRVEGHLRQACYRQGRYHDKIVMSLLKSEWQQQVAEAASQGS